MAREAALSWTHSQAESPFLRALAVLPLAVVGTGVVAVTVAVVGVVVLLFVGGNYAVGIALLLAVAVMSVRLVPHQMARSRDDGSVVDRIRELGPGTVGVAVVVGLAVWAVGAMLGRIGFVAVVVGTVLLPLAIRAALSSEGHVDPETATLTYCGTDLDLATLDGIRRLAVGSYVVYRLSFVAGAADFGTPRWLVVPRRVDSTVRTALDSGVAAEPPGHDSSNRAVRVVAGVFALGLFGFAAFLLRVEPTTVAPKGDGVLLYVALVSAGFGLLFVGIDLRGG